MSERGAYTLYFPQPHDADDGRNVLSLSRTTVIPSTPHNRRDDVLGHPIYIWDEQGAGRVQSPQLVLRMDLEPRALRSGPTTTFEAA